MSLYLPESMPIIPMLRNEGYRVNEMLNAQQKHIMLLNIMPEKQRTELDFARVLANVEGFDVKLSLSKFSGQTYKNTAQDYVDRFYRDWEEIAGLADLEEGDNPEGSQEANKRVDTGADVGVDGMIITGAPLEFMPFEEVRYWEQLCKLMDWGRKNVRSVLYVCWGAQAGMYHFYGIDKHLLEKKMFGVYRHNTFGDTKLLEGLTPNFIIPHSRHTEVRAEDLLRRADVGLEILAESRHAGVGLAATRNCSEVFMFGHPEYAKDTLHREYQRDLLKGVPIKAPENYYLDDNEKEIAFSWCENARTFYHNWVKWCL